MTIAPLALQTDYWETFDFQETDLDYLYNYLLEIETPLTPQELVRAIINERIKIETEALKNQQRSSGKIYMPEQHYEIGETLLFPALDWKSGKVTAIREGTNPDVSPFEVIEVVFSDQDKRQFAANLDNHPLNQPLQVNLDDPNLNSDKVMQNYGQDLIDKLTLLLEENEDLIRIAGRWFPRALLVDVNIGYLNLAEALLDMESGGPLPTRKILEQIELPTDTNIKLTEFSLNLALDEDGRFDEVGPAGEVLWFLRRLEPEGVQNPPIYLRYQDPEIEINVPEDMLAQLEDSVIDELIPDGKRSKEVKSVTLSLIYPHWRAGTLPLAKGLTAIFPTAIESPRVLFTFIDADTGDSFYGWVVRSSRYVYGLREWYENKGLMPGSIIHIRPGNKPGEVLIQPDKKRPTREWIRTVLIGADEGVVFATLKQLVSAVYDDRMAIAIPDYVALDSIWEHAVKRKSPLEAKVISMMRELTKLSPQGHVHAQELYAAVNIVRRSPPAPVLDLLVNRPWAKHLGDLYFRLDEDFKEGKNNE
jgi:hypothetical protein